MVSVKREGIILEPTNLEFENHAVMNPTCVKIGNDVHMFYRAVKKGNYSSIGYCKLDGPLKVAGRKKEPFMVPEFNYENHGMEDPRIVFLEGVYYIFYTAYDGKNALVAYATSRDLKTFEKKGAITPTMTYDKAEDFFPEKKLKDRYFLFESFFKCEHGKDVLLWEKDAFLFPKKFNGKFALV
ncbi:MAG: pesticidal protein Cry7Aa, partial [Candidatus Aenigmarchaeota archaeon]